jgi:heme/copper-type cytochrome/quinol oxidase subunit 3
MEIPYTVQPGRTPAFTTPSRHLAVSRVRSHALRRLFSAYVLLRVGATEWPHGWLNVTLGTINTIILALSAITTLLAWVACKVGQFGKFKFFHACTLLLALTFLCIKCMNITTNGFTTKST